MKRIASAVLGFIIIVLGCSILPAQVPQIINYQGRVVSGSTNFNGAGSFKFALVNADGSTTFWSNDGTSNSGSEPTNAVSLSVSNGLYSVLLGDSGVTNMTAIPASVFNDSDVRLRVWFNDGAHGSQLLTPDQRVAAVGYAMTTSNFSGVLPVINGGTGSSTGALNATGTITADLFDATTQFNIAGNRVLSMPGSGNLFAGLNAGIANTNGSNNSFFGSSSGQQNTTGYYNAFFGQEAGSVNDVGYENSFFGSGAGRDNTSGADNSFFGKNAGITNTTGGVNTFLGTAAGTTNQTSNANTFVGGYAGLYSNSPTTNFTYNSFYGYAAGYSRTLTGTNNTIIGAFADLGADGLNNATALGYNAIVAQSNSLVLGNNANVGIGTSTPKTRLTLSGGPNWTSAFWAASLNLQNASALGWEANASGQRFGIGQSTGGLYFFRSNSAFGDTASPANYDMELTDGGNLLIPTGNLGIGTTTPLAGYKLDVNGAAVISPGGGGGGNIAFGTPNSETGVTINGANTNRADIRFDNATLKLVAGPVGGPPASTNGIAINTSGLVGIGTTSPTQARLHVNGAPFNAVYGSSRFKGVWGDSDNTGTLGIGVYGTSASPSGYGLYGINNATGGFGIYAEGAQYAGYFKGNVNITGIISKGGGSFKIDHPLDPANKFLSHSFVESPDMMNIYNGNITTDASGDATIEMPDYFEALNRDFRYQLTVIGQFAQAIIASEMNDRRFTIKTDRPYVKVSWQVTGIRHDAFAEAQRIVVEEEKVGGERGTYLHPEFYTARVPNK